MQAEFFKLAGWYLGCRLRLMGGDVEEELIRGGDFQGCLQGLRDSAIAMRMLCYDTLGKRYEFVPGEGWRWE